MNIMLAVENESNGKTVDIGWTSNLVAYSFVHKTLKALDVDMRAETALGDLVESLDLDVGHVFSVVAEERETDMWKPQNNSSKTSRHVLGTYVIVWSKYYREPCIAVLKKADIEKLTLLFEVACEDA